MTNIIHLKPEEQLAKSSSESVAAIKENTQKIVENTRAIKEVERAVSDRSDSVVGFTGVAKRLDQIKEEGPKVLKKLEEVKSATLITNQELKKLNKKEAPKEMEVTLKDVKVLTIRGKDGYTPKKGKDYYTDAEIAAIKKEITPIKGKDYDDGKDGYTPRKGIDYKDGEDGEDADEEKIIEEVLKKIPPPAHGYTPKKGVDYFDGSPDSPDEVVEKFNASKIKINLDRVKGLPELVRTVDQITNYPRGGEPGGGPTYRFRSAGNVISEHVTEINFASNLAATYDGNGRITISATSGVEVPVGTVNGSNTTFTVSNTPVMVVSDNATYFEGAGFTYAAGTITMTSAPFTSIRSLY